MVLSLRSGILSGGGGSVEAKDLRWHSDHDPKRQARRERIVRQALAVDFALAVPPEILRRFAAQDKFTCRNQNRRRVSASAL